MRTVTFETVSWRVRRISTTGNTDSLLINVDQSPGNGSFESTDSWHTGQGGFLPNNNFQLSTRSQSFVVSSGRHELVIAEREDGILFSALVFFQMVSH